MCVYICLFGLLANVGAWGYDNDKSVHYNITFFGKLVKSHCVYNKINNTKSFLNI